MSWRKVFRRGLTVIFILASLLIAVVVKAEVKTYTGAGEYYMSDFETFDIAQQRAKQRAERDACEKAGIYVESRTKVINAQVTKDEIITMTSGILKVIDVKYHREHADNNTTLIRATVKAQIDDSDIIKWLNKDSREKSELVAQMEALRKANEEQERQIADLRKQLSTVKTPQDRKQITQTFANEDKIFLSNQKVEEAVKLYDKGDYNGVIKLCNEAIELNPKNEIAYGGRGDAYYDLGQYERAIQDYNKVIELNPNWDKAYYNRGNAYYALGQKERAIQDYNKAIELNPNDANTYYNRGLAYRKLENHKKALADFNKYIQLVPNDYDGWIMRGKCYESLGEKAKAQADFAKAKELGWKG